ncbi:MAG TPA: hypothetical protein VMU75_00825 [Acidimicrobiales bacterium]|nr:hypothetical protein [Acidimicrobiales bacterium]
MKGLVLVVAAVLGAIGAGVGVEAATGPSLPHFASALPLPLELAVARTVGVSSVEVTGTGERFAYQAPDRLGPLAVGGHRVGLLAAVVGDASYVLLDPPGTETAAQGGAQVEKIQLPATGGAPYAARAAFFPLLEIELVPTRVVMHGDRYDYTYRLRAATGPGAGGRRGTRVLVARGTLVVRGGYVTGATWQARTARGTTPPPGSTPPLASLGLSTSFTYGRFGRAPSVALPPERDVLDCPGPAERLPSGRWRCG